MLCFQVIDPWGKVLLQGPSCHDDLSDQRALICCLSSCQLTKVRENIPVQKHRRSDIFVVQPREKQKESPVYSMTDMLFSDKLIPKSTIFLKTKLSYAFTNIRCVVPGRILLHFL